MSITKYDIAGTLEEQLVATQDALNDVMDEHPGFITSITVGEDNIKLYNGTDAFFKIRFNGELGHRHARPGQGDDIDNYDDPERDLGDGLGNKDGINYIVSTNNGIVISWNAPSPISSIPETLWITKDQNGALIVTLLATTIPDSLSTGKMIAYFWGALPTSYTSVIPFVGVENSDAWYKWFNNYGFRFTALVPVANNNYQQSQYSPYLYYFKYSQINKYVCKKMTLNDKDYFTNGMLALLDG